MLHDYLAFEEMVAKSRKPMLAIPSELTVVKNIIITHGYLI